MAKAHKWSSISIMHMVKLVYRSTLFLGALIAYILGKIHHVEHPLAFFEKDKILLSLIWLVYMVEMFLRCFPSKLESMGCQKQFTKNFAKTSYEGDPVLTPGKIVIEMAALWVLLNGIFGALYLTGVFDRGIMLLISLVFGICDIVCILFFCPFQTLFMKNKCCGTCRIYNWDYAMMFTPLLFVPGYYSWTLLGASLILLLRWEVAVYLHPERFSEATNACLACQNCPEKLCQHKRQLRSFLQKNSHLLQFNKYVITRIQENTEKIKENVKENTEKIRENVKEGTEKIKENIQSIKDDIKNKKNK